MTITAVRPVSSVHRMRRLVSNGSGTDTNEGWGRQ
jgi:hypothetical protein